MNIMSMAVRAVALQTILALCCVSALATPLPDGGFETLPLSNHGAGENGFEGTTAWVAHDDRANIPNGNPYNSEVNVVGSVDGVAPVFGGIKQALIENGPSGGGGGVSLTAISLAAQDLILSLNAATGSLPDFTLAQLQALDPSVDPGHDPTEGAALSQSFKAEAGGTISFNYDFLTADNSRNDLAFFMLSYEGGVSSVTLLASSLPNGAGFTPVPSPSTFSRHLNPNPATFSLVLPGTGDLNYFVAVGVVDQGDIVNTSGLLVDGFQVSTLILPGNPEPSSAVLLVLGMIGFVGRGRRKRQRA